ncbi:hypothetical protein DF947_10600 [Pedobacter paludis]|uniref:HTH cro/C1-type domain-containing protein n=2 Tax=Pedobacter paludis TaxID=2203212 RepID=A0A317EZ07_9SPHI|nr:hypothetical protein DF947_10600 [Pedobacter paludis]
MIDEKKTMVLLGNRVAHLRRARGQTIVQMSHSTELDYGFLRRLEKGQVLPSVRYLIRICNYFDVSLSELFDFDGTLQT